MMTMKSASNLVLKLALPGMLLAAAPAMAGTRSFAITGGGGMVAGGGATESPGGIFLPATGAPEASFTLLFPLDYVKNTGVTLDLYFHTANTGCSFVLAPTAVVHRRPGVTVDGTTSVLAPKNSSWVVAAKRFTLMYPTPGSTRNEASTV